MNKQDKILLGLDLKKSPEIIRAAYNDKKGYTAAFNLNLLNRINHELGANFVLSNFMHWPIYEPHTGTAKSYIVSKCKQSVTIPSIQKSYSFEAFEAIHTEISQKYDTQMIERILNGAGLKQTYSFKDKRNYFTDIIVERI